MCIAPLLIRGQTNGTDRQSDLRGIYHLGQLTVVADSEATESSGPWRCEQEPRIEHVEEVTLATERFLERERIGGCCAGYAIGIQDADRAVVLNPIAGDCVTIGVRRVGEATILGDDHPARRDLVVGQWSINELKLAIHQTIRSCSANKRRGHASI